jgi:hypothetical protein
MVNGWPNGGRFTEIIGGVIQRSTEKSANRFVFAFGGMVALRCSAGKPEAALRLEQFCNSLTASYHFSLCCAYPLRSFVNESGPDTIF